MTQKNLYSYLYKNICGILPLKGFYSPQLILKTKQMKLTFTFFVFIILFTISAVAQTTGEYQTTGSSTNWNALTTWVRWSGSAWVQPTAGQGYPGQNTSPARVTILGTHSVTLNVSPANTLGDVVLASGSTLSVTGTNTLNVTGSWTNNGGTFIPGSGTVTFSSNVARTIGGTAASQTFNNLTINKTGGGTLSVAGNTTSLTINGTITLSAGTFSAGTAIMIYLAGNWTNNGGVFTGGIGGVNLNGTSQTIGGNTSTTFNILTILNNSSTTLAINTNAANVVVSNGIFTIGNDNTDRSLTVTGKLTVASSGTLRTAGNGGNVVNVAGDLENNGVFDLNIGAATAGLSFNGNANQTVYGTGTTTDVSTITINNSGAANNNIVEFSGSAFSASNGFLTLTRGVIKMSGSYTFSNTFFNTATPVINTDEGIWINNPNVTVQAQNGTVELSGLIRITAGTFNIGTTAANSLEYNDGAKLTIEGGALNIGGRLCETTYGSQSITYNQSNGVVTVNMLGNNTDLLTGSFSIGDATSSFTMSGGTIVMQRPVVVIFPGFSYVNYAGTYSVTGGTIQFGNSATPAGSIFEMASSVPLWDLTISATNTPTLYLGALNATTVLNDVTIGGVLDAQTLGFLLNEDLIVGRNWVNNGTFTPGNGTVTFNSVTQAQVIGGSSNTTFYNLTNTNTNPTGLSLSKDVTVNNVLTFASGSNGKITIGTNNLTIASGGSIAGFNSTRYIVSSPTTASNGRLRQNGLSTAARVFPVGTAANYLPVTITPASSGSDFSINTFRSTTTSGLPGGSAFPSRTFQSDAVYWIDRVSGSSAARIRFDWQTNAIEGAAFNASADNLIGIWVKKASWLLANGSSSTNYVASNSSNYAYTNGNLTDFGTAGTGYPYIVAVITVLPVEISKLEARKQSNGTLLNWEVTTNEEIVKYELQRSTDGRAFETIAVIPASASGSYSYTDVSAKTGIYNYRVKVLTAGNETIYSSVVTVSYNAAVKIELLQNPVVETVVFKHPAVAAMYMIVDLNGRTLQQGMINSNAEVTKADVSRLPAGTYVLHYMSANEKQSVLFKK